MRDDVRLLSSIFRHAHIVDLDFSQWDKFVRIVASAHGLPRKNGRCPTFNIDFVDVADFRLFSGRRGVSADDENAWTVADCVVRASASRLQVALRTPNDPSPTAVIACTMLRITEVSDAVVDATSPDLDRSSGMLARPSLEELVAHSSAKRASVAKKRKKRS
jgi:hypothetical protein